MNSFVVALIVSVVMSAVSAAQTLGEHLDKGSFNGTFLASTNLAPIAVVPPVELQGDRTFVTDCYSTRCDTPASFVLISATDSSSADSGGGAIEPVVKASETRPLENVQWRSLAQQSSFYLGVMHGFRLATEPGTREALHNSVFGGYFKALGSLHGWSDGDGYYENYLGHPLQGAVSGYLWIHNDPRYRTAELGDSRDYWMGRLRAYAFAWAFSEQFEIGLLSEASIGQIQRYCCQYGFVDHIITPNAGLGLMVGLDAVDKYVTQPIERRTKNRVIRVIARVALNPPLSFANLMAFQAPWHRENRSGVLLYDGEPSSVVRPSQESRGGSRFSEIPRFEVTATLPSLLRLGGFSCVGGGGIGAFRLTDYWRWTVHVDGCGLHGLPQGWHGDSLTFMAGPQWIAQGGRWSPNFHIRMGGQKVTEEKSDSKPEMSNIYSAEISNNLIPSAPHYETTGLSLSIGGGMGIKVSRALTVQVANLEYIHSWLDKFNNVSLNRGFRFSTGVALRIGTW